MTLCVLTSTTNQEPSSTWSETQTQVRPEPGSKNTQCFLWGKWQQTTNSNLISRLCGEWANNWQEENCSRWQHQDLLWLSRYHPPEARGKDGGQHSGHISVLRWQECQAAVVWYDLYQRGKVSDTTLFNALLNFLHDEFDKMISFKLMCLTSIEIFPFWAGWKCNPILLRVI